MHLKFHALFISCFCNSNVRNKPIRFLFLVADCQLKFRATPIPNLMNSYRSRLYIVADFNNDHQDDIFIRSPLDDADVVLLASGNSTFTEHIVPSKTPTFLNVVLGDFNNDEQLDIAFAREGSGIDVWLGNTNLTFEPPVEFMLTHNTRLTSMITGDFNHDNYLDIVCLSFLQSTIFIFLGTGNGSFIESQQSVVSHETSKIVSMTVTDFNRDNHSDIIYLVPDTYQVYIWFGHGDGTFVSKKTLYNAYATKGPSSIHLGDFNRDARLDFIVVHQDLTNAFITLVFGLDNETMNMETRFSLGFNTTLAECYLDGSTCPGIIVDDFNGDHNMDFIAFDRYRSSVNVFFGDGYERFERKNLLSDGDQTKNDFPFHAIGDFNSDGYKDILSSNRFTEVLEIFLNTGVC